MNILALVIPTPDALGHFAQQLAASIVDPTNRDALEQGLVLDLRGHLGSGKTVFVRALARALGVPSSQPVLSPTYTLHRVYELPGGDIVRTLHHLDAYRTGGPEDFEGIGFEELCGSGRLTAVEWGDRVEEALPDDRLMIELETVVGEHDAVRAQDSLPEEPPVHPRRVLVRGTGPHARALLEALRARIAQMQEKANP